MLADCWWHGGKSLATLFEEWRSLSLPATGTEDTEIWECSAGMKMASLVKADISCLTSSSIQIRNLLVVERPARQCPHHLLYANYQLCAWLGLGLGAWHTTVTDWASLTQEKWHSVSVSPSSPGWVRGGSLVPLCFAMYTCSDMPRWPSIKFLHTILCSHESCKLWTWFTSRLIRFIEILEIISIFIIQNKSCLVWNSCMDGADYVYYNLDLITGERADADTMARYSSSNSSFFPTVKSVFYVSCWNECRGVVFKKIRVAIGLIFYKKSILGY